MAATATQPHTEAPVQPAVFAAHEPRRAVGEGVFVVGYDDSPTSRAAIAEAARRAGGRGRLIIVRAVGPGRGEAPVDEDHAGYGRAVASLLAAVRSEVRQDVPYEIRVVAGDSSSALAEVVRRHHGAELVTGRPAGRRGGDPTRAVRPRAAASPGLAARRRHGARGAVAPTDVVEQHGLDSFPASDPPSWWAGPSASGRG